MFCKFLVIFLALFATVANAGDHIVFTKENTIALRGEIDSISVAAIQQKIFEHPAQELYLVLDSAGGSIVAGSELVSTIKNSGKKINCVATFAASMAFVVFQSCHKRYVLDNSIVMQHVASYSLSGPEPNNWQLANFLRKMIKKMNIFQAKRIGISLQNFESKTRDDWWLHGEEAVDEKVADDVVTASCSPELAKQRTQQDIQMLFWTTRVIWSGCPLVSGPLDVQGQRIGPFTPDSQREFLDLLDKLSPRQAFLRDQKGAPTRRPYQ